MVKNIPTSKNNNSKVAIIAIHGWKGNLSSMEHVANALNMKYAQWIFIQGPYAVGDNKYSWFEGNEKEGWRYQESFDLLHETILDINKNGFPKSKIFLLGFSQGGCLAMEFIIRQEFSIGGIIPIAGFIGKKDKFKNDIVNGSQNTPVLLIHGSKDEMVLPVESKIAFKLFSDLGFEVQLQTPSVGHKIPLQTKGIIEEFILKT
jgi:phospholipase/carboxylesterase